MSATPTPYTRQASFTSFQTEAAPTVGTDHEAEYNKIAQAMGSTQDRLAEIQRDDGRLKNLSVHVDALSAAVRALFAAEAGVVRGEWAAVTSYSAKDVVTQGDVTYLAVSAHTSGADFDVDKANGLWVPISGDAAATVFLQAGDDAVARTLQDKVREQVSVFDYMTTAQIADVQAYTYGEDVTAAVQAAIDAAFARGARLLAPAGGYAVTGLTLPGRVDGGTDDRGKALILRGEGCGEPFVVSAAARGTIFKSTTDAPLLQDYLDTDPSSNGTVIIEDIRFDGTSATDPVILLQSFYGLSIIRRCAIYQRGDGDGIKLTYTATTSLEHLYVMNKDFVTAALGAARVGKAVHFANTAAAGLITINKVTARGFKDGFYLDGTGGAIYSPRITNCECSYTYNGISLITTRSALIDGCYLEGGDEGTGILDQGDYTTIRDSLIFPGYLVGIDATSTTAKGTVIEANVISLGAVVDAVGISVASSAAFGGYNKNVVNNSIVYTAGTAGVSGILVAGTDPRLLIVGNAFDPRGAWTGAGSKKITDNSSAGVYGIIQKELDSSVEILSLSRVDLRLAKRVAALTGSDVSANVLTLPEGGSYFDVTAAGATTVQQIDAGLPIGRIVVFKTTNANMTFQDTAALSLAGGASFTGPGTLTLLCDKIGGNNFAYELARSVF